MSRQLYRVWLRQYGAGSQEPMCVCSGWNSYEAAMMELDAFRLMDLVIGAHSDYWLEPA